MRLLIGQALGFVAMAFCIGSYQIKSSRGLILCKTAGDALYVIHYLMLGQLQNPACQFYAGHSNRHIKLAFFKPLGQTGIHK